MSDPSTGPATSPVTIPPDTPHAAASKARGRSSVFDVIMGSRSRRRRLIRQIEAATGRALLCYVSEHRPIEDADTYQLHRLIETIETGKPLTLLLNSPGGLVDPAEKMVHLLREASPSSPGALEVVIPAFGKSAATLMALGGDRIVMSDFSELGPIDPQINQISVFAYLLAYEEAEKRCEEHPGNPVFADAFANFDPVLIATMRQAASRARNCAENLLKRPGINYTAVAAALMDIRRFPSHGQMIDWRTARSIGLEQVEYLDRRSDLWTMYWRLYRRLAAVSGDNRRVFESARQTIIA